MWNNFSGFIWRGKKCILFSGKSGNDSLCIDGTGNAKAMTSVPSNFPAIQISNSRNWKIGPLLNYDCHRHTNSLNILVPKCCTLSVLFNDVVNCYGYTAPVTDTWLRMKHRWSDTGWEKQPSSAYNRSQWVSVLTPHGLAFEWCVLPTKIPTNSNYCRRVTYNYLQYSLWR